MEASVSSQHLAPAAEGHLRLVRQVVTGHYDEAAKLGAEALRVGKQYRSERIVSSARTLRSKLPERSREVDDLDRMLISLYDEEQG